MGKKKETDKSKNITLDNYTEGRLLLAEHPLFSEFHVYGISGGSSYLSVKDIAVAEKTSACIRMNTKVRLSPERWAYSIAHARLHFAFGHFDTDRMPGYDVTDADGTVRHFVDCDPKLWNIACDMYIANFLASVKFRGNVLASPSELLHIEGDERKIYEHLLEKPEDAYRYNFGTSGDTGNDMRGIDPHETGVVMTEGWRRKRYTEDFAVCLAKSVSKVVDSVSAPSLTNDKLRKECREAAEWFTGHYPLLGGVAAAFSIVCDEKICEREEISIAAVDPENLMIYINPFARLSTENWKFVLAHEYLHAGLGHGERCQGRNPFLWNVACDYVVNGWLREMGVGIQPEETLYDPSFRNMSCESVYDALVGDMKKYMSLRTYRGAGLGDILGKGRSGKSGEAGRFTNRDDFCRTALMQGLEAFGERGRGTLPAGLVEEIRALGVPPVPWDVQLAKWFDEHFVPAEKKHTYQRASRRQSATPDIPRLGRTEDDALRSGRTFGVVIDTSGSMSVKEIAYALGAVASYSAAKDVPLARVVFCDAAAYDEGYLSPEEISGRVTVKGRGGTELQPGVDLLEQAEDFPKDGPILLITDGEIENHMTIHREHAFLMPAGARLPFRPQGEVFRFYNQNQ